MLTFFDNSAIAGGGIYVQYDSECTFENTVLFSGNKAKESGGSLAYLYNQMPHFFQK